MPREIVRSKYFCKQVMEESLNDFQETKNKCIGPKIVKKTKQKPKPKKRVKGQKDIRTLIQKKNELVTFTKDFNNVCTKSGIDIDSQELQLAIALSKSLHEQSQSEAGTSQSNKILTSQERTNNIRRTLQEYGFKVPETKIKSEANKRLKRHKRQYKLLLITEEERQEKISDRYSQILFQYPDPEDFNESHYGDKEINKGLYYLCTNISHNFLKSNDIFYVPDLLQEITVKKGSLLRDWSDIPGRPCSPLQIKDCPISLSDIDCSQAELNTILSGTITAAREIFKTKINLSSENKKSEIEAEQSNDQCEEAKDPICEQLLIEPDKVNISNDIPTNKILENSTEQTEITMLSCKDRSLSPDLFGDDASSVIDNTINHNNSGIATPNVPKTKDNAHILNKTKPTIINLMEPHYLPNTSDVTKRKSNDFMDLTECVITSSQRNKTNLILQSQASESKMIYNDCMEITECVNPSSPKCYNIITPTNIETCIDLVTETNPYIDKKVVTSFDLTLSSNSDDDLPMVDVCGSQNSLSSDTIIVDYDDYGQFSNNEEIIDPNKNNVDIEKNNSESFTQNGSQHMSDKEKLIYNEKANSPLEISEIDLTQSPENVNIEKSSLLFSQDMPEHISVNKDESMPVEKVNEKEANSPLEISDIVLTKSPENVDIEKNNSELFSQDMPENISKNNDESMPLKEINENDSDNPLEINDIDLTESLENVNIEKNNPELLSQDMPEHIENKDKSVPLEEINENYSINSLETNNIDLTQTSDNVDVEKDNSVFIIPDVSQHISDTNDKSIPIDEVMESNSEECLEPNNMDLTHTSENRDIEKNNSLSIEQNISDKDKSILIDEENDNNTKDHSGINDIDLTESSDSIDMQNGSVKDYNNLGKIGDISIDYDEICIDTANNYPDDQFDDILSKYGTSSSNVTILSKNSMEISSHKNPASSSTSEVFKLSDRELDYSLCKSHTENIKLADVSIKDDNFNLDHPNTSYKSKVSLNRSLSDSCLPSVTFKDNIFNTNKQTEKYIKLNESIHSTPIKAIIKDDNISVETPTNSEYVIKVGEVTPMLDYATMSSPERNKELEKYGLKPFKRKRAIQLLTHLYNQTHPIVEYCSEEPIPAKKLKTSSPIKKTKSPKRKAHSPLKSLIEPINTGLGKENEVFYKETKDLPDIREIECSSDDWVFQTRENAKVHSCRVPLHIAFHNYVSCRRGLRESILRYEPVNIDVIHKDLVSYGYRYNPKDLLKFLDKKCITVKTADNNARNSRK